VYCITRNENGKGGKSQLVRTRERSEKSRRPGAEKEICKKDQFSSETESRAHILTG